MTYDDDMVRLTFMVGTQTIPCKAVGLEWPPPERLTELNGMPLDPMVRVSMSVITDEQRAEMTHVFRGAVYVYEVSA